MIKGKRGTYSVNSRPIKPPYDIGEWVLVNRGGDTQMVGKIKHTSTLVCTILFYMNETWTEVESGLERVEVNSVEQTALVTAIACKLPEEVAKNLLLLQGVEL
jgi:hypothetical protein